MAVGDDFADETDRQRWPVIDEMTGEPVADPDGQVIAELEATDYLELQSSMTLEQRAAGERAWRFGHVIVDEAQDLTPMQWRMVSRRARGHSMTIVGDLAQRSAGRVDAWADLLPDELGDVARHDLQINYRSPEEIGLVANGVLAAISADLTAPRAIRASGHDVVAHLVDEGDVAGRAAELAAARATTDDAGRVAVLAVEGVGALTKAVHDAADEHALRRITVCTPVEAKGLEFDAVIVVGPAAIVEADPDLAMLYVAVTRSTDRLDFVHATPLPSVLADPTLEIVAR